MRLVTATLFLAGIAPGVAAQAPDTVRLTLAAAVQRALAQGTDTRLAAAAVMDANGQVREALAGALPQVTGTIGYTRQFASIYQGLGGSDTSSLAKLFKNSPFGAPNAWNLQLQVTQLLWAGGKVGAGLAAARAFRQAAELQQAQTAADVTFQVTQAYWDAALQSRLLAIAVENLDQARQHLREVRLYQQAGTRAEYDLLRAEVDAANQEPAVVAARNAYEVALLGLRRRINVPAAAPLVLESTLSASDTTIPVPATDSLGGPERAGLAAAEANVREQEELLRAARADRWPTLSASTTYNQQAFPSDGSPLGANYVHGWNGQLTLSIPIFLGFRTEGAVAQARAALLRAQAERDDLRRQVELDVTEARGEVARVRSLLAARHGTVREARRAQYLAGVRYTNGMATQLDVTDARIAALQAEVNEVQATRDYYVALAQLERALGRSVPVVEQPVEPVALFQVKDTEP